MGFRNLQKKLEKDFFSQNTTRIANFCCLSRKTFLVSQFDKKNLNSFSAEMKNSLEVPVPPSLKNTYTNNIVPSLDYILLTHCGGMGKWQLKNSFFVLLIFYASLYPLFVTVFTTYAPEHRCHIEQCDINNQTVNTEWLSYAIPNQESSNTFLSELQTYDSCRRFQRIDEGTVQ